MKGNVEKEAVLQTVSKTGKKTEFWPEEAAEPEAKTTEAPAPVPEAKPTEAPAAEPESKPTEAVVTA